MELKPLKIDLIYTICNNINNDWNWIEILNILIKNIINVKNIFEITNIYKINSIEKIYSVTTAEIEY